MAPTKSKTSKSKAPEKEESRFEDGTMSFLEHLGELRTRLIRSMYSIVIAVFVCFFFAEHLYAWLVDPLIDSLPEGSKSVYFLNPVEPFLVYLKLSLLAGVFVSSPAIFYQLWKFVAPGLYEREKRAALPFVMSATFFFVGGALFCRYVVLPVGLETLMGVGFQTDLFNVEPQITMQEYFSVSTKLMLAFGIVFELPVIVLFLSYIRLVNHKMLLRHWRAAIVVAFIVGAILTPPDPATQLLLAGPMLVLYFLSIGIAYVFSGAAGANDDDEDEDEEDEEDTDDDE